MVTAVKHQIINVIIAGKNSIFSRNNDRPVWLYFDYGMEVPYMATVLQEFHKLQQDFVRAQNRVCMCPAR